MFQSWDDIGISIFSTMTEEANKVGAVNLAQGFPDFDGPKELIDEAIFALTHGFNQYAPSRGYKDLLLSISDYVQKRRHTQYNPETEICVFSGATEALFCAVLASCQKGDELLCFEPFFDVYPGLALVSGSTFKTVKLRTPDWSFDADELKKSITSKTKALILNSPHNPTGKVFTKSELQTIADLAIRHNLTVITDEVYEEIVFQPNKHISLIDFPGMKERCIRISSAAKTFSITGWKIGYALASASLIKRMRTIHEHLVFCSASPLEKAAIKAYQLPDSYFLNLRKDYETKKKFLSETLTQAGFKCYAPEGAFFIIADYSDLSEMDDVDFTLWMTRERKLASIPLSNFFRDKNAMKQERLVRFCFAKTIETLMKARDKLQLTVS